MITRYRYRFGKALAITALCIFIFGFAVNQMVGAAELAAESFAKHAVIQGIEK